MIGKKRKKRDELNDSKENIDDMKIDIEKISKGIIKYYSFKQKHKDKIDSELLYLVDKKWLDELIDKNMFILNKMHNTHEEYQNYIKLIIMQLYKENKISVIKFPETIKHNNKLIYINHTYINEEALDYFSDGFNLGNNYKENLKQVLVHLNSKVYCIEYDSFADFQFMNQFGRNHKRYIIDFIDDNKYFKTSFINKTIDEGVSYIEEYSARENINVSEIKKKNGNIFFMEISKQIKPKKEQKTIFCNLLEDSEKDEKSFENINISLENNNKKIRMILEQYFKKDYLLQCLINYYCIDNYLDFIDTIENTIIINEAYLLDKKWITNFKSKYKYDTVKTFCQNNIDLLFRNNYNSVDIFYENYTKEIKTKMFLNDFI